MSQVALAGQLADGERLHNIGHRRAFADVQRAFWQTRGAVEWEPDAGVRMLDGARESAPVAGDAHTAHGVRWIDGQRAATGQTVVVGKVVCARKLERGVLAFWNLNRNSGVRGVVNQGATFHHYCGCWLTGFQPHGSCLNHHLLHRVGVVEHELAASFLRHLGS